jgi:hypothetical protein
MCQRVHLDRTNDKCFEATVLCSGGGRRRTIAFCVRHIDGAWIASDLIIF